MEPGKLGGSLSERPTVCGHEDPPVFEVGTPAPREEHMSDTDTTMATVQRGHLKNAYSDLVAKRDSLLAELRGVEDGDADVSFDEEGGEGSGVSVERDRLASLISAVAAQLDDTEVSLARLEGGTYGICESCHQAIPATRLEAVPHARLCVSCKAGGLTSRR
jgi:DnaK suppressor protein